MAKSGGVYKLRKPDASDLLVVRALRYLPHMLAWEAEVLIVGKYFSTWKPGTILTFAMADHDWDPYDLDPSAPD